MIAPVWLQTLRRHLHLEMAFGIHGFGHFRRLYRDMFAAGYNNRLELGAGICFRPRDMTAAY